MHAEPNLTISPGLFSKETNELKVLYSTEGILALEKPKGIITDAHPWYPNSPSLVHALNQQYKLYPQSFQYPFEKAFSIYFLEPEITGIALLATNKNTAAYLRNEFGSEHLLFKFLLLAKSKLPSEQEKTLECDLPLAKHFDQNIMIVSNKSGKKTKTKFKWLSDQPNGYQLWEAQTHYLRMHQIRIHAMECGLQILGEKEYTYSNSPKSLAFKTKLKNTEMPNNPINDLYLHLSTLIYKVDNKEVVVESPLPEQFKNLS